MPVLKVQGVKASAAIQALELFLVHAHEKPKLELIQVLQDMQQVLFEVFQVLFSGVVLAAVEVEHLFDGDNLGVESPVVNEVMVLGLDAHVDCVQKLQ